MSPVEKLFKLLGGPVGVQRALGIKTSWATSKWLTSGHIPPNRIISASEAVDYKVTPHELNPKLYPFPTDGVPESKQREVNHEERSHQEHVKKH